MCLWARPKFDAPSLKHIIHGMGDVLDFIGDYVAPIALSFVPGVGPGLAAAYTGIKTGVETGNPFSGLLAGAGSFAGNALGSSLGSALGSSGGGLLGETPINALGNTFGGSTVGAVAPFGSFAGNALGSSNIGSFLGGAAGGNVGESLGRDLGGAINPMSGSSSASNGTPSFSPTRSAEMSLPSSLSQLSGMDPFQQSTNIASKGVYGGGQGANENSYFLNLINRQLVDDQGKVGNTSSINPVQNSYLSQLGLGGYSDSNDLLKKINQYAA